MKTLYDIALLFAFVLAAGSVFAQQTDREKGIELYDQGKYQEAVEILQKTVETDKDDKKSWLYLGMSQARLKKQSQAEKSLRKADKIFTKEKATDAAKTQVKIISKPRSLYTDEARMNQTQGTIKIAVEFGADGSIKGFFPFQQLPNGLTEKALEAVEKVKFEPATKDGKPYSTIGILTYSFTIY